MINETPTIAISQAADSAAGPGVARRHRVARWYETCRRPAWVLVGLVLVIYGRTLPWGLVLDDHHHFQIFEDYRAGKIPWTPIYDFLDGERTNAAARIDGDYPWWLGDDLRYRHWRPVAERLMYGQFVLFGREPLGYRLVNLALYAAGVVLVLRLFQVLSDDDRLARWGALVFALMASHLIPVVFISAQGDPLSLVLVTSGLLLALRFTREGAWWVAAAGTGCYILALGTKEACLPIAVVPLLFDWVRSRGNFACLAVPDSIELRRRQLRARGLTLAWALVGCAWLLFYLRGGYGSNALPMLSPGTDPLGYLAELPLRVVVLLTGLVVPVNPFLFFLREQPMFLLGIYCAIGVVIVSGLIWVTWHRHRSRPGVGVMSIWIVLFMPLLACTVPDDRILMLPSIGLAFLAGAWITRHRGDGRLSGLALTWFLVLHTTCVVIGCQIMRVLEREGDRSMRLAIERIGRAPRPGDHIFILNSTFDSNVLFAQAHLNSLIGRRDIRVSFLTDTDDPIVTRLDYRTLRLRADGTRFFTGFLGAMSQSRAKRRSVGETFRTDSYTARIVGADESGGIVELEIEFDRPLEDESYHFFECGHFGEPSRWNPPPLTAQSPEVKTNSKSSS